MQSRTSQNSRAVGSWAGAMAQVGDSLSFVNPKRLNPHNQQWQLSVQRQLPSQVVVEAENCKPIAHESSENRRQTKRPFSFANVQTALKLSPILARSELRRTVAPCSEETFSYWQAAATGAEEF